VQEQREESTADVLELDRRAWNLPIALMRPLPSQPQFSVKSEREDNHEAGPEAA
jgi:hypothetical protein